MSSAATDSISVAPEPGPQRRWLAPEVVQTSAMDCGPAALKCLLEGHGVPVSYGRLREACQTDVDGTSIDTLELVAQQLGLDAAQVMLPADHLLLPENNSLPALVVVQLPDGMTHFIVAWDIHLQSQWVQVMDPTRGRRWLRREQFLNDLYIHRQAVPATDWREWAASDDFCKPLLQRLKLLGLITVDAERLLQDAQQDPDWYALAALDAATRMTAALIRAKALSPGEEAARLINELISRATQEHQNGSDTDNSVASIPENYWSVLALPAQENSEDAEPLLLLTGAVLLQVNGLLPPAPETDTDSSMPAELAAALSEPSSQPELEMLRLLRSDGLLTPAVILFSLLIAAVGVMIEALLFRGLLELGQGLGLGDHRFAAVMAIFVFLGAMLLLEYPISSGEVRIGRRLENHLRMLFMTKIPRLHDRYFSSRLTSDMAHRVYELRELRKLPTLGILFLRTNFELLLTTAGLIWLYPGGALIALLALIATVGIWLLSQPLLIEQDLNLRTHEGALSRFYLDAMLGLTPVRTHGAEKSVRREHEGLLVEWVKASLGFYRTFTGIHAVAGLIGVAFSVWLLLSYLHNDGALSGILLLFYWTLRLPALGQELARILQQYPMQRNRILRLLEPLGAPEESEILNTPATAMTTEQAEAIQPQGNTITLENLHVFAGGHAILQDINLQISAGEHIAVVGSSGAGKSSLVGLLLGWHRPAHGRILINQQPLDNQRLQQLRRDTAWVDPAVQIWNRSLLDNLRYGNQADETQLMNAAIEQADLFRVLERLPDGMQTQLGEGGGLVSGGEGQRVRLGRAMLRSDARLVILDEPFRGLDRAQRQDLLRRAREHWANATLIFISHDVGDTQSFDRVLVIEQGHIVEDAAPKDLFENHQSRYRALLDAEQQVREGLWASQNWRRLQLQQGQVQEQARR